MPLPEEALLQALEQFVSFSSWDESQQFLEEHPELLTEETVQLLEAIIKTQFAGDLRAQAHLEQHRRLLVRCREVGIEQAFAELRAELAQQSPNQTQADLPSELPEILQEINRSVDVLARPRRVELSRQALTLVDKEQDPNLWAAIQVVLGISLCETPAGPQAENLEEAIRCYNEALTVMTREAMPVQWAEATVNLGNTYAQRILGDRAENLEKAIRCYQQALTVMTCNAMPVKWATTMTNLGNAYFERIHGDRAENVEKAIRCHHETLTVMTHEAMPVQWAIAMMNLGSAYAERVRGIRAENLEEAIRCYHEALTVMTREAMPLDWAITMQNLGAAYAERIHGDRADNLEEAIRCYQQALKVRTREGMPTQWAKATMGLGDTYLDRIRGDRAENLEAAIRCFQRALTVMAREALPTQWAEATMKLGNAYRHRIRGEHAENLEEAIRCIRQALTVRTREAMPDDWGITMHNLGAAYAERVRGNRAENLEEAIRCYQQALTVTTREAMPLDWATSTMALGAAYANRICGERAENLEKAIHCHQQALTVMTREALPVQWAEATMGLGEVYRRRIRGDRAENLEEAIRCFQQALTVTTREAMPDDWGIAMHNLGAAYAERVRGNRAENLEEAICCFHAVRTVITREAMPVHWSTATMNLASAYRDRICGDRADNLEEAIRCYQQALTVRTREGMPAQWAEATIGLGAAYIKRIRGDRAENMEKAIRCYSQALFVCRPETLPVDCRIAAGNLGNLLFYKQRWEAAAAAYRTAVEANESLYEAAISRGGAQAELAQAGDLYQRLAWCQCQGPDWQEAVWTLEQGRARLLSEALARDRRTLEEIEAKYPEAAQRFEQAAARLGELEQLELSASASGEQVDRQERFRLAYEAAQQAQAEMAAAAAAIRELPGYEDFLAKPSPKDVARAAYAVPSAALVYLLTTDAGSVAFIVPSDTDTARVPVNGFTSQDLESLLVRRKGEEIVGGYLPAQLHITNTLDEDLDRLLPEVGTKLIAPLARHLREIRAEQVVLIPCGRLGLLPLHAATYEYRDEKHAAPRQRCLLDEFCVHYAPNARAWEVANRSTAKLDGAFSLFAVGNPLPLEPAAGTWRSLPYAQVEAESLGDLSPASTRILCEQAATREAVIEGLASASVVHFACHGTFDSDTPLDSHLQLADGKLMLRDLLGDAVSVQKVRLAVLSACQTAISDFRKLPDETIGLPAGLLQAGVAGVVATLWPVEDRSTAIVMVRFYELLLEGTPPAEALRRAQLWLRDATNTELAEFYQRHSELPAADTGRMPGKAALEGIVCHSDPSRGAPDEQPYKIRPYHWAPFVYVGA